jgi:hypothetical protein
MSQCNDSYNCHSVSLFIITVSVGTSMDFRHQIETMKALYRLHLSGLHRRRYLLKTRYLLSRQGKALLSWNLNIRNVSTRANHWTSYSASWFHLRQLLSDSITIFFTISYLTHTRCISSLSNPLLFIPFNNIVTYTVFRRDDDNGFWIRLIDLLNTHKS